MFPVPAFAPEFHVRQHGVAVVFKKHRPVIALIRHPAFECKRPKLHSLIAVFGSVDIKPGQTADVTRHHPNLVKADPVLRVTGAYQKVDHDRLTGRVDCLVGFDGRPHVAHGENRLG